MTAAGSWSLALFSDFLLLPELTVALNHPFIDCLENSGFGNWSSDASWEYTTEAAHCENCGLLEGSDTTHVNDANASVTRATGIDLTSAVRPVVSFEQRDAMEITDDFGVVEVSSNSGAGWATISIVTETRITWRVDDRQGRAA